MALLLGSRGRSRSRSSWLQPLRGLIDSWFGKSMWKPERAPRPRQVPGWLALLLVLGAFGGGYLVGGRPSDSAGLHMRTAENPGLIGEVDTKPLSTQAFVVAAYENLGDADAKARAKALAEYLKGQGLARSRPYEYTSKEARVWMVVVYYDNDQELIATRDKLRALPAAVPDEHFVAWRMAKEDWPLTCAIQ
jgi:hypothetical protein